ncbi:MAG: hypothetical protein WA628_12930 [Terriglobales bacterium]
MILLHLMGGRAKLGIVIVLLLCVMAVFISPAVDLEPTALRALKAANMLFAALILAGTTIAAYLTLSFSFMGMVFDFHPMEASAASLVDLNCVRLC